jgi:hypothetical protein
MRYAAATFLQLLGLWMGFWRLGKQFSLLVWCAGVRAASLRVLLEVLGTWLLLFMPCFGCYVPHGCKVCFRQVLHFATVMRLFS